VIAVTIKLRLAPAGDAAYTALQARSQALEGTPGLLRRRLCRGAAGSFTLITCWADLAAFERWMATPWRCAEECAVCPARSLFGDVCAADLDIVTITAAGAAPILDEAALCIGRPRGYG
jgi:quinol monooxygenase YgiN